MIRAVKVLSVRFVCSPCCNPNGERQTYTQCCRYRACLIVCWCRDLSAPSLLRLPNTDVLLYVRIAPTKAPDTQTCMCRAGQRGTPILNAWMNIFIHDLLILPSVYRCRYSCVEFNAALFGRRQESYYSARKWRIDFGLCETPFSMESTETPNDIHHSWSQCSIQRTPAEECSLESQSNCEFLIFETFQIASSIILEEILFRFISHFPNKFSGQWQCCGFHSA